MQLQEIPRDIITPNLNDGGLGRAIDDFFRSTSIYLVEHYDGSRRDFRQELDHDEGAILYYSGRLVASVLILPEGNGYRAVFSRNLEDLDVRSATYGGRIITGEERIQQGRLRRTGAA